MCIGALTDLTCSFLFTIYKKSNGLTNFVVQNFTNFVQNSLEEGRTAEASNTEEDTEDKTEIVVKKMRTVTKFHVRVFVFLPRVNLLLLNIVKPLSNKFSFFAVVFHK